MISVTLPWPHKDLSPNARKHWAAVARHKAVAKAAAHALTRQAMGRNRPAGDRLTVTVEFCPPCARRRDLDNMLASLKAALDGVSLALGVDDSKWNLAIRRGDPVSGGCVNLWVSEAQ